MNISVHISRNERVRNARDVGSGRHFRIVSDGDPEMPRRTVKHLRERRDRSETHRVVPLVERDSVGFGPKHVAARRRVVEHELDVELLADRLIVGVVEAPLVRDGRWNSGRGRRRKRQRTEDKRTRQRPAHPVPTHHGKLPFAPITPPWIRYPGDFIGPWFCVDCPIVNTNVY